MDHPSKAQLYFLNPRQRMEVDGCSCIIKIRLGGENFNLVANSLILSDLSSSQFDLACLDGDCEHRLHWSLEFSYLVLPDFG